MSVRNRNGIIPAIGALLAIASIFGSTTPVTASGDNGYLIDDVIYYNKNSMSVDQINTFINGFAGSCLKPSNYPSGLSWATFREPLSYFDYSSTDVSPAQIIWKAAQLYNINPQVILATLEKEQALVSGNTVYGGCVRQSYNSAMGYNCPDGSENSLKTYPDSGVTDSTCVAKESNVTFSRQVNHAAWQLSFDGKRANGDLSWMGDGATYYYGRMTEGVRARVQGGAESIYDGRTTIDGVSVYLRNGATAALYNYTPHYNSFNAIFSNWFGSVYAYTSLETPRWMKLASAVYKIDGTTGQAIGGQLALGTQLRFVDKVYLNGNWYLRTEYDSGNRLDRVIKLGDIEDISYEAFTEPRYMILNQGASKFNPASQTNISGLFSQSTYAKFASKIYVNGTWYYRTEFDTVRGNNTAFSSAAVSDVSITDSLDTPRYMRVAAGTQFVNLRTGALSSTTGNTNDLFIAKKVLLNNAYYFQLQADADSANLVAADAKTIADISFEPLASRYAVKIVGDSAKKYTPNTGAPLNDQSLVDGQVLQVARVIVVAGIAYYQTEWDYAQNLPRGVLVSDTLPTMLPFVPLVNPRAITATRDTYKIDPLTGQTTNIMIPAGASVSYSSKVQIGAKWYLRTAHDSAQDYNTVVAADDLQID